MSDIAQTHKGPTYAHKPGSPQAVTDGCLCAVIDNHHGNGFTMAGEQVWWISVTCPLHGGKNGSNGNAD